MAKRRVAVEFVAEMGKFRAGTKGAADDVRKLKDESVKAKAEIAKLGRDSVKAADDMKKFARGGRAGLIDMQAAARSARADVAKLTGGVSRMADSFGRVNGTAGAAVATLRMVSPVLTNIGTRIKGLNLKAAARDANRLGRGLAGAAGDIGGGASKTTMIGLAAIPAASAAASASLQAIPPLLAIIGGGLGAIPSLAAGAAGSIGTLKLATAGLGDSIGEIFEAPDGSDPYDRLSRSGKRFVDVLANQRDALLGLQRVAQDRTFAGLDQEVSQLAAVALPFATRQVTRFGDTWNDTFRQIGRLGRDPQFLAGLDDAFASVDTFFDGINMRIPTTGRALGQLFTGARPFVDAFGSSLLSYVDDFSAWIDRTSASGDLSKFFADAGRQADALLDIGKEVLILVGRIGGMQQGSTLLRDMADALARFNDEAHNMRSVEGVIATGNAAIRGLVQVLAVLGETLGQTLADPATRDAIVLFFDVLTVGAQIVGDLVQVFGLLPDPIQSAILAGVALAILWGKIQGVGGKMATAVGAANDRLAAAGPAGQRAGRGLQTASMWAGRAATAFLALQVASVVLDQFADSAVNVDALTRSLEKFVRSGELGGEMTRQFGDGLDKLDNRARGASDGWFPKLGRSIEALLPPAKSLNEILFGGSFTGDVERFKQLDAELLNVAKSTNDLTGVSEAYRQLLAKSGLDMSEFQKLLPGTSAWLADMQAKAHGLSAEQQLLNGTMEDAIGTVQTYTRVWAELNGVQLTTDQKMLAANEAIKAVSESFKENGKAITGNSTAALENRIAVGQAAQAAADAAQAKYEETGSIKDANTTYNSYITQLRKTLTQAGLTKGQIDRLIGSYASMPKDVTTRVSAKIDGAKAALGVIRRTLDSLNGKTSNVYVHTYYKQSRATSINRDGGVYEHAQDGLINLRQAGVYSPVSPARYAFAEPATQGEAFIPKNGNRERSISIGRRAMEWYGMDVVPKSGARSVMVPGSMGSTPTAAGHAEPQIIENHIHIGDEVTRVIRTEISDSNRTLKRRATAGAGAGR